MRSDCPTYHIDQAILPTSAPWWLDRSATAAVVVVAVTVAAAAASPLTARR